MATSCLYYTGSGLGVRRQTLGTPSQPLAMAVGATRLLFIRDLQGFLMGVPFIIIGMWIDGLTGIVYARALTGSISVFLHMQVVKLVTGLTFREQFASNTRSLTSVCIMVVVVFPISLLLKRLGFSTADLVFKIAILVVFGAASYLGSHAVMWTIMGKPNGPEREMMKVSDTILRRFKSNAVGTV